MASKSYKNFPKDTKHSNHKGLTVVNQSRFSSTNEELKFAKEYTKLTTNKSNGLLIRHQRSADR